MLALEAASSKKLWSWKAGGESSNCC